MGLSVVGTTEGVVIMRACKDPERAMQFFNRMAEDDVLRLINWGIEGEHYIINDKGRLDLTDAQWEARRQPDFAEKTGVGLSYLWNFPHYMEDWVDFRDGIGPYGVGYCDKSVERLYTPEQLHILNNLGWATFTEPFGPMFLSPFGFGWDINIPPERDDLADINDEMSQIDVNAYYQRMMLAGNDAEFESLWAELTDKINAVDRTLMLEYHDDVVQTRIRDWN